jgi:glycosyltransferase involved in cell wall biosynthesis
MRDKAGTIFLYDSIFLQIPGIWQRGVARYFRQVIDGLITHFGPQVTIFSAHNRDYGSARHIRALTSCFRGSNRLKIRQINEYMATFWAEREHAAVFYSPYYGNIRTKAAPVYTVYDMIHELYPHHFPDDNRTQSFLLERRLCFERAALLLAISQSTARDIAACYPNLDSTKVVTTLLGVDEFFFGADRQSNHNLKPYILYVGYRNVYKNFRRLLQAFGQSGLAKDFDLRVISPGPTGFSMDEIELLHHYQLENSVHLQINVDDSSLRDSYAGASVFIYPSEYEGFGLPILEAMASGAVVATSNTASMPEIGGDIAFYFDPFSIDSISDCLSRAVNLTSDDRGFLIAQGIARAHTFTWSRCQWQTVDAIAALL